jgi:hypothetical protein
MGRRPVFPAFHEQGVRRLAIDIFKGGRESTDGERE